MAGREIVIETAMTADELRARSLGEANRRARMRMQAIANELDGYDREEAARLAGMSDQALRDAIKRFNAEGLEGLYDRPRSGRPPKLDAEQDAVVKSDVLAGPDIEKDGLSAYTLDDIRRMIAEKHGVHYHIGYMGSVMARLGLSRQKTRPSHPQQDPAAAAVFKKSPTSARQSPEEIP